MPTSPKSLRFTLASISTTVQQQYNKTWHQYAKLSQVWCVCEFCVNPPDRNARFVLVSCMRAKLCEQKVVTEQRVDLAGSCCCHCHSCCFCFCGFGKTSDVFVLLLLFFPILAVFVLDILSVFCLGPCVLIAYQILISSTSYMFVVCK